MDNIAAASELKASVFGRTNQICRTLMQALTSGDQNMLRDQLAATDPFIFDSMFPDDDTRQDIGAMVLATHDPESIRSLSRHEGAYDQAKLDAALYDAIHTDNSVLAGALIESGANVDAFGDELRDYVAETGSPELRAAIAGNASESSATEAGDVVEDVSKNRYYVAAVQKTGESYYERGHNPLGFSANELAGIDNSAPLSFTPTLGLPMDAKRIASYLQNPVEGITVEALTELQELYSEEALRGPSLG